MNLEFDGYHKIGIMTFFRLGKSYNYRNSPTLHECRSTKYGRKIHKTISINAC